MDNKISAIVNDILIDYQDDRTINKVNLFVQPDTAIVEDMLAKLIKIIFPGFFNERRYRFYNLSSQLTVLIEDVFYNMNKQIALALKQLPENEDKPECAEEILASRICEKFFESIPKIRALIETDVQASFDGDPAAFNKNEIILCYPGLYAITVNRIAHELYKLNVPIIPRIMTEHAHSQTGIDIHPGATIGEYFFIDHGTGIVIGETTTNGKNVKIYQGVTLGALSLRGGQKLKNKKRHPTIEDDVTIYSGASILGGETVIGQGSTIGSNAFITKSVAPHTKVSIKNQELNIKGDQLPEDDKSWFYII